MNCAHPGCKCHDASVEKSGKQYCSDHCAGAGTAPGGTVPAQAKQGCGCGHPACK